MRAHLTYIVLRAIFVLGCLMAALLAWPGPTGAGEMPAGPKNCPLQQPLGEASPRL